MLGASLRADVDPLNATNFFTENLFGLFVDAGPARPTAHLPYLLQGGLGMPDREYYLSDEPRHGRICDAYRAYIARDAEPGRHRRCRQHAPTRIFDLEMKIARAHADARQSRTPHARHNPGRRADFATEGARHRLDRLLQRRRPAGQQTLRRLASGRDHRLAALVASEPLAAWKD